MQSEITRTNDTVTTPLLNSWTVKKDEIATSNGKTVRRVALSEPKLIRHKKYPFVCQQTHLDIPLDGSTNNNNGFFRCCMILECGSLCGQIFRQKSHWARHCKKIHATP